MQKACVSGEYLVCRKATVYFALRHIYIADDVHAGKH